MWVLAALAGLVAAQQIDRPRAYCLNEVGEACIRGDEYQVRPQKSLPASRTNPCRR